jgi:hypothetical protein
VVQISQIVRGSPASSWLDPVILDQLCQRRFYELLLALRRDRRRDLAERVGDRLHLLLPPEARPQVLRRLGRLTR